MATAYTHRQACLVLSRGPGHADFLGTGDDAKLWRGNWFRATDTTNVPRATRWPREGSVSRAAKISEFFGPKSANPRREVLGATLDEDP